MSINNKNRSPFPSQLYLPKLAPAPNTILDYLIVRFPYLAEHILIERIQAGLIFFEDGRPIALNSPYQYGIKIFYYRESEAEPEIEVTEQIIFENDEILIVDKPHFMPVTPAGKYVNQSLLARLVRRYNFRDFTPVHRLDRETAGLVLFSKNVKTRGLYHKLFQEGNVIKKYYAVGHIEQEPVERKWHVANRIVTGEPWYCMQIIDGEVNAITDIELIDIKVDIKADIKTGKGLFNLVPTTGKKHQLRLHLASLGFSIVNDTLYPTVMDGERDQEHALQLLAYSLAFIDPISGENLEFTSQQRLAWG